MLMCQTMGDWRINETLRLRLYRLGPKQIHGLTVRGDRPDDGLPCTKRKTSSDHDTVWESRSIVMPYLELEGRERNFLYNLGMLSALRWIHTTARLHNAPLGSSDGGTRGLQVINLAAVHTGITQRWDDHPARMNHFNPERFSSRPNSAMETPPESPLTSRKHTHAGKRRSRRSLP